MSTPITVFIVCRNRPIHLWTCLDALYVNTKHPCNFIIADNCSTDPMVKEVIDKFKRREMFHDVILGEENNPNRFLQMLEDYKNMLGDYFVGLEADVAMLRSSDDQCCWLNRFYLDMEEDDKLGAIGARVFEDDYVPLTKAERVLGRELYNAEYGQLWMMEQKRNKLYQPEVSICYKTSTTGRVCMIRTETLKTVVPGPAKVWFKTNMVNQGYKTGIDTRVVYRHLSLLNIYDYPEYRNPEEKSKDPSAWTYMKNSNKTKKLIL